MSFLNNRADNGTSVDPKNDPHNPLRYLPSNALTTVGVITFFVVSCAMTFRLFRARWRARYMLAVIIGGFYMTFGLAMRYPFRNNPDNLTIYLLEDLFVVLSPCAFIAANYALLGRLAQYTGTGRYLIVKATILTKVFVGSDVITFLIQATGGSLSISKNPNSLKLGANLFKLGMILQCLSFVFFCIVYAIWVFRVRQDAPEIWSMSESVDADGAVISRHDGYKWHADWRALVGALALSCFGILIRSAYRTVEGLQGYHGALATSETTFYALDTLPLFIAIAIYVPFWPGQFIDPDRVAAGGGGGYEQELSDRSREDLNKPYV